MAKLPEDVGNLVRIDLTDGQLTDMVLLYLAGQQTTTAIGAVYGIAASTVAHRLRALGVKLRPRGRMKREKR